MESINAVLLCPAIDGMAFYAQLCAAWGLTIHKNRPDNYREKEEVPGIFLPLRVCISNRSLKTPSVLIEVDLSLFLGVDTSTSGT